MKINITLKEPTMLTFKDIEIGELFTESENGEVFMKTNCVNANANFEDGDGSAVMLEDGLIISFGGDCPILRAEGKMDVIVVR